MLNDLKFAAGAIARKDFVPLLQYFRISEGRIYGYNGRVAISAPTDLAVTCVPKAASLIKAVEKIPDGKEIILNLTNAGKLSVKSGRFRVYIDCIEDTEAIPRVEPAGVSVPLTGEILPILAVLAPFMGIDASRPWACGIRLHNQSAFATNNIILIEHWLPSAFPVAMTLPSDAVKEMLRIGIEPCAVQVAEGAATFHYPTGAWLRTQLVEGDWPDLSRLLDVEHDAKPIPAEFFDAVGRLDAFAEKVNRLHIRGGTLATSEQEGVGALVELDDFGGVGCHFLNQMAKLDGVATHLDFSMYPRPCLFFGNMLRGAIVGLRSNDAV